MVFWFQISLKYQCCSFPNLLREEKKIRVKSELMSPKKRGEFLEGRIWAVTNVSIFGHSACISYSLVLAQSRQVQL